MILEKLQIIEKTINSELSSKIQNSTIKYDELLIEIDDKDLIDVIQFLKLNDNCKFRQLIDIAGVDYPQDEKRFELIYLFLSHELNIRIKLLIKLSVDVVIKPFSEKSFARSLNSSGISFRLSEKESNFIPILMHLFSIHK